MMHHDGYPTTGSQRPDRRTKEPTSDMLEATRAILDSEAIAQLDLSRQAEVIVDGFIGMLMRNGPIQGSNAIHTPSSVLETIDYIHNPENVNGIADPLEYFTSTNNLREAVRLLTSDERFGLLPGAVANRIYGDEQSGTITLTTPGQVVSYLSHGDNGITNPTPGVEMHGDTWVRIIAERATAEGSEWIDNPYEGMIKSQNKTLRDKGNEWRMAVASAKKAGVDMDLLGRSARYIKQNRASGS